MVISAVVEGDRRNLELNFCQKYASAFAEGDVAEGVDGMWEWVY